MRYIIATIILFGFYSCAEKKKSIEKTAQVNISTELTNFDLITNFENCRNEFSKDTFELNGISTEGGELIVFHANEINYLVLDFSVYGETGKINNIYWTDKELRFKLVRNALFKYDKPFYEQGYKTDSIISFLSYQSQEIKMFDNNGIEINSKSLVETKAKELELFFDEMTKGIQIIK